MKHDTESKSEASTSAEEKVDPPKVTRYGLPKRLLLAFSVVLIMLLAAELVLRLIGFSYYLYPSKIEFGAPTPEQIESGFIADRDLLWVTKDYAAKLEAARRQSTSIVFMGDSCTEWGIYPERLEGLVARRHPKAVLPYASVGTPAWSSFQGLQQLKRDILPLKPKVITVYYGWNDHWKAYGIQDKEVAYVNSSMFFQMQKYSRVAQLFTRAYVAMTKVDDTGPLLRVSLDDFRSNLREMVRLAEENDIEVVLLTAPTSHEKGREPDYLKLRHLDDLSELTSLHQQYVEIVREVAGREQVTLCDLARVFENVDPERLRTEFFYEDGIHLRPAGDSIIAFTLYGCLEKAGLLNRVLR